MQNTLTVTSIVLLSLAPAGLSASGLQPQTTVLQVQARSILGSDSPDGDALTIDLVGPHSETRETRETPEPRAAGSSTSSLVGAACGVAGDYTLFTGSLPEGDTPMGAAFTTDGSKIVVAHRTSQNLIVFDAATRAFLTEIALSGSPNDLALSSDGVHAVTANIWEDTASIVDLTSGMEVAVVPVGDQPGVVRITPGGTRAVVGNTVSQSLSVIDIGTASELHRIVGSGFTSITTLTGEGGVVTSRFSGYECVDDTTVVHPDFLADEIDFFDIGLGTVSSVPSNPDPRGIALTPDGATAVVAHFSGVQRVSVIDTASQTITKSIATGVNLDEPIAVNPGGTKAVVSVLNACRVVDLVTDAVSADLPTASVNGLLTTADGLYALAVGFRGSLISYSSNSVVKELNNIVSTHVGAVSPTGPRAVLIAVQNGENMLVVNTAGAAGFLEADVPSGPPPEADSTRKVAITPDGARAVTTNILSDNASIVNLDTGVVEAILAVGDRPADVEISSDGDQAVVANLDSSFVSIIDLNVHSVANITTSTRNSEVELSPDGQFAYVAVVVADGVWRINLDTLGVQGPKLPTGQMGNILYGFQQASGMSISHDGATLVTCNSFDDTLTLIDTASWSVLTTVGVGDFPGRALFSDDDSTLFVSNRNSNTVSIVNVAGAASSLTGTVAVGDWPFEMAHAQGTNTLYVASFLDDEVDVVDVATTSLSNVIPLPDAPQGLHLDATESCLYAASGSWSVTIGPGPVTTVNQSGYFSVIDTASEAVAQEIVTGIPPAMLVVDGADARALVPSPFVDGLLAFTLAAEPGAALCFGDGGGTACPCSNPGSSGEGCRHSGGVGMTLSGSGSSSIAADDLTLSADQCPLSNSGIFYSGDSSLAPGNTLFDGVQCAGGNVRRYQGQFQSTGSISDTGFVAQAGAGYFVAGTTYYFQYWSRDVSAGPSPCGNGANFSPSYAVTASL